MYCQFARGLPSRRRGITGTLGSRMQNLQGSLPPSFPADHFYGEIVLYHGKPFLKQILMELTKLPDEIVSLFC